MMDTIGTRIKTARKAVGMTQIELASKLGISYVGVSQWERDLRHPKYETLKRIADALGCAVTSLMEGRPLTNADRIRAMSDEELANLLTDFSNNGGWVTETGREICYERHIAWLQQPAEEVDHESR